MTTLNDLVRNSFEGKLPRFRPCAYYDDRLDCIRVVARDCSVLETRINPVLTVLEDNYYDAPNKRYIGFTVKGARHFCNEHGISTSTPVDLSKLLDAILRTFPEPSVQIFVNLFAQPLVKKEKIGKVALTPDPVEPVLT